ncbi:hypothetical protein A9Q98_08345 [Thalassotalea sp. 42_200_T64]|nr:hypothetical protein A9Q98_08345 [Thalassotalea sp. 42_200_T64]
MIFFIKTSINKLKTVLARTGLMLSATLLVTTVAVAEQDQVNSGQEKVTANGPASTIEQAEINAFDENLISLEATFFGNKEQPKVITIVPWQNPEQQPVNSKLISAQMSLIFEPVEVDSLQREVQYYHSNR